MSFQQPYQESKTQRPFTNFVSSSLLPESRPSPDFSFQNDDDYSDYRIPQVSKFYRNIFFFLFFTDVPGKYVSLFSSWAQCYKTFLSINYESS
jgi:hypothetical protein